MPEAQLPNACALTQKTRQALNARLAQGYAASLRALTLSRQVTAMTAMKRLPTSGENARVADYELADGGHGAAAIAPPSGGRKIAALNVDVQRAIEDKDPAKVDKILSEAEKTQTEALERQAFDAAKIMALRGEIALSRSRYSEAAGYFAAAASTLPAGRDDEYWTYLNAEADALYRHGNESGDRGGFESAIERYRDLTSLRPRNSFPRDWAMTQMNLGVALQTLGERESGALRLDEAVSAYRNALQEYSRARVPQLWAMTKMSLGTALFRLGERESETARLEEAIAAFREALQEYTRERAPLDWARTQMNLGVALETLGTRENGTAQLEEAIAAHREVLQENIRDCAPALWAMTQMSLGSALFRLGQRQDGMATVEEAVTAYREALKEQNRERVPLQWAATQICLGNVLTALGMQRSGTAELEEAVAAFRDALQEYTRTRAPLQWAMIQVNLGTALFRLGEREDAAARFEETVAAYHEALQEYTRERAPLAWAGVTGNQGVALTRLAGCRGDEAMARRAVVQIESAIITLRDGGRAHSATELSSELSIAQALADCLAKH